MVRFIITLDVSDKEFERLRAAGHSAQDVADGIVARLHPVAACHPDDEVLSTDVHVTHDGAGVRAGVTAVAP